MQYHAGKCVRHEGPTLSILICSRSHVPGQEPPEINRMTPSAPRDSVGIPQGRTGGAQLRTPGEPSNPTTDPLVPQERQFRLRAF